MQDKLMLRNGLEIPRIGLGTWQITAREEVEEVLRNAYQIGYRLIDTAAAYSNEMALARAIRNIGLARRDLFLSDKLWNTGRGFREAQEACRISLKKLKTDYLDLYLIHWPASMKLYSEWEEINAETWRGMEALYKEGMVKAIGVCNFKEHHLSALEKTAKIMPMINQIEMHPGMPQLELLEYCNSRDILIEASSPLGNGQVLCREPLLELAQIKQKTPAQICLRWGYQKGAILIPKTTSSERLKENLHIFDFDLSDEELLQLDKMPYCGGIGIDPDTVVEFG